MMSQLRRAKLCNKRNYYLCKLDVNTKQQGKKGNKAQQLAVRGRRSRGRRARHARVALRAPLPPRGSVRAPPRPPRRSQRSPAAAAASYLPPTCRRRRCGCARALRKAPRASPRKRRGRTSPGRARAPPPPSAPTLPVGGRGKREIRTAGHHHAGRRGARRAARRGAPAPPSASTLPAAAAKAAGEGSARKPVRPWATDSVGPPLLHATTGRPAAIASRGTMPKCSFCVRGGSVRVSVWVSVGEESGGHVRRTRAVQERRGDVRRVQGGCGAGACGVYRTTDAAASSAPFCSAVKLGTNDTQWPSPAARGPAPGAFAQIQGPSLGRSAPLSRPGDGSGVCAARECGAWVGVGRRG